MASQSRTPEQLREHYAIERELAARLRDSSPEERRHLYSALYDEMFRRVPLHPQLTQKASPEEMRRAVESQIRFLRQFLREEHTFLEVGPGDCAVSLEAARVAKQVYAIDVSDEITKLAEHPPNFRLVLCDGSSIPVPPNSVHVAYSKELMEHLHCDDAVHQLESIYQALAPGGVYVCITPNRLGGPHDISRYFDDVATGFHLKEYTTRELMHLFKEVGFSRIRAYVGARGAYIRFPARLICACEAVLESLPKAVARPIARSLPFWVLLGVRLVGTK